MTCQLLSSGADKSGSDLAVAEGHFAMTDEQADLTGARVLHVSDKTLVVRELLVGREW
jgi:hypothetical protein